MNARLRAPESVVDEDRHHLVRDRDQLLLLLARRAVEQHALVGDAGAVVDAVVDREAVAEVLEHGPARGGGDHAEARDDQPLEEHLHQEHLLLERVEVEEHRGHAIEVRVALTRAAGVLGETDASVWRDSSCTIVE